MGSLYRKGIECIDLSPNDIGIRVKSIRIITYSYHTVEQVGMVCTTLKPPRISGFCLQYTYPY